MQERLRAFGRNMLDRWNLFERSQKIKIGVTAAVLLITLIATIYITTRPQWVVLVNNKSTSETGAIENALKSENIAVKIVDNATGVSVKAQDRDRAMIVLSDSTALRSMDFTFQDALDASGMGSTERVKTEAFRRAFLSDLNSKLENYDWVQKASVDIVFTDEDNFLLRSQDRPTAAILLHTNRTPDDVQATNVARLVSRSVKNLSMDDIEITDQNAQTLYSGLQKSMGTSGSEYDIRRQRENEMDAQVRKVLQPIYDEVKTIPTLNMNWNRNETESTTYSSPDPDSPVGVPLRRDSESQSVTGSSTDQEPGAMANAQTTPTYQTGTPDTSEATSKSLSEELLYNTVTQRTESSIGDIVLAESSLGVYVFKYRHYYQETMQKNNQLVDQTWEEFMDAAMKVETPLTIDPNLIESIRVATGIQQLSVIGYEVPVFHEYVAEPVRIEQYIIFAILALLILMLAYGLIRRTQPDEVIDLEQELTVEDLLVSTQLEEAKEEEDEEKMLEIGIVTESESRQQINKFIDDRPEVVAALLRNWLNDDWE